MNIERQDRVALGIALLATVGSAIWFGGGALLPAHRTSWPAPAEALTTSLERAPEMAPSAMALAWDCPRSQSAGANWVYEVFTPPTIEREARSDVLVVRTPVAAASLASAREAGPGDFGLELRAVARAPFRLQLVGYTGAAGRCRGVFEDRFTGRTFLADEGRRAGESNYVVESVAVERLALSPEHPGTVRLVAKAVLRDVRTGARVELTDQGPALTDAAVATVALAGGGGETRVVFVGDEIVAEDAVFRIGKIRLAPPSLEATKVSSRSPSAESRVLFVPATAFAGMAQPTL